MKFFLFKVSRLYPENRKAQMSSPLKTLLSIKSVAVKDIQDLVLQEEGVHVFSQDVRNWRKKMNNVESQAESQKVENILLNLQAEGGVFKFGTTGGGEFRYLAFITRDMLHTLNKYPEVIVMDTTYKVNNNNYPLLNVLIIDNNGQGRPVFHALLASEDSIILSACLSFFVSSFNSHLTKTIFIDKDMSEICAIRTCLPEVTIRLCAFHIVKAVKKALQQKRLATAQVSCILDLFKEQKSCQDLGDYQVLKEKISEIASPDVVCYFEANWWNCPQLWATSFLEAPTYHITTTNHAESFHQKIKRVLNAKTPLSVCITELISMTKIVMQDRDASACINSICMKYNTKFNSSIINQIQNDLTPFGARIVIEQFLMFKRTDYTFQCSVISPDVFLLTSSTPGSPMYDCTTNSCSCDFFNKFQLPCRHIFSLRAYLSLPLYQCDNERFKSTALGIPSFVVNDVQDIHELIPTRNASTPESRYHLTRELTKSIDSFLPLLGERAFETALSHLRRVFSLIQSGLPMTVLDLSQIPEHSSSLSVSAESQDAVVKLSHVATALPTLSLPTSKTSVPVESHDIATLPCENNDDPCGSAHVKSHVKGKGRPRQSSVSVPSSISSVPDATLKATALPTLSLPISKTSVPDESHDTATLPCDNNDELCGFADVKLSHVKTKGRPRQKQSFTRNYGKRKAIPQAYHSRSQEAGAFRWLFSRFHSPASVFCGKS